MDVFLLSTSKRRASIFSLKKFSPSFTLVIDLLEASDERRFTKPVSLILQPEKSNLDTLHGLSPSERTLAKADAPSSPI